MVLYRSISDLPTKVENQLSSLLLEGEEFVAGADCNTGLRQKYREHLLLTTQRFIVVNPGWFDTDSQTYRLEDISAVEFEGAGIVGIPALTVYGAGEIEDEYKYHNQNDGQQFTNTLRKQIANI